MTEPWPQRSAELALRAAGGADCVAIADVTTSANLRWAGNTLTTNGLASTRRLTVIAIDRRADGAGVGMVSRSGLRADQAADVVAAAQAAAGRSAPAQDEQPLVGHDEAGQGTPHGPGWDDAPAGTGIGVFESVAADLGEAFGRARAAGRLLYGFAEHSVSSSYLATSSGLRLRYDQPSGRLELNAKSADGTASAWAGEATPDFAGVDVLGMESGLATRLGWAERRIELPAGRYPVLLPPGAMADLLIYMYWSANGRDAIDGRSVFSRPGGGTRIGDRLGPAGITLRSDPAAPGLRCAPFVIAHASSRESSVFDDGLPLRPTSWIADGVLTALTQTRYSAKLCGQPVTPLIGNLMLDCAQGAGSLEQLIAGTDRALLLTCLWYIREVDPRTLLLTGLTRDGVYLVENGEIAGAVNNFRFNESPVSLLGRIAAAGATQQTLPREWSDYFRLVAMPPVLADGFNMSSVSQAS